MALNNNLYERYSRQVLLKPFGEISQEKLLHAKVLVVGAGGLGCPVLQYLAAAGIGTLGIVDDDVVARSNLHWQLLYSTNDIGPSKAGCAGFALQQWNPDINIITHHLRLTNNNALALLSNYDIVVDGTDHFSSRYLINDACVLLKKPFIYGSIYQFEGQVALFNCMDKNGRASANYRDLFPQQPGEKEAPSCNETGVIGILPGIIGAMMANECIKFITGIGTTLINRLLIYNSLNNQIFETEIIAKPETKSLIPANENAFTKKEYSYTCSAEPSYIGVDAGEFNRLILLEDTIVIDVREKDEKPAVSAFKHTRIPMSILIKERPVIREKNILLFCHSGIRSAKAALLLSDGHNKVYNLKGGIVKWMAHQQTVNQS